MRDPYTQVGIEGIRARLKTGSYTDSTTIGGLLATVEARDAEIASLRNHAKDVKLQAMGYESEAARLREALVAARDYLLERAGDECAKCRISNEDDPPYATNHDDGWFHVGEDYRVECRAQFEQDALEKILVALSPVEGSPKP